MGFTFHNSHFIIWLVPNTVSLWTELTQKLFKQGFGSTWVHLGFFGGVRVAHLFSFLCCLFCFVCLCFVSCAQCCMCMWIVHSWLTLRFSLTLIYHGMSLLLYFDPLYTGKQKEQGQICLTNAGRKFHKDSKRKKMEIEIQIQHFGLRRVWKYHRSNQNQ